MKEEQYSALAPYYEALNSDVDYSGWADFLSNTIHRFSERKPELVLELACGTGAVTRELSARGFDMIGIDISSDMLAEAERSDCTISGHRAHTRQKTLYLCQDIRSFELYGTVGAAVCCLDGINYLTKPGDLDRCFGTVHTYLEKNGVFIFDVNSPYKFEKVFAEHDYVIESDGVLCSWQNSYNPRSRLCDFYLSVFSERADGSWERRDEVQRERCFSRTAITRALVRAGFELLAVYGSLDGKAAEETDERWFFVTKRI